MTSFIHQFRVIGWGSPVDYLTATATVADFMAVIEPKYK